MVLHKFAEKRFDATQAALSYVESPAQGAPLVLLHGAASRWQPFQPILPALAVKYHVYALDLRGHGRSSHTPGAYRLGDYTRDLHDFIEQKAGKPAAVYGHSLGALVAINLAAQHPQDVCCLILGDPPLYYHDTRIEDTFWQRAFSDLLELKLGHPDAAEMDTWLAQNYPNMSPERREERVCSLETLDPDTLCAIISDELMQGVSLASLARSVACPVLLLRANPKIDSVLRKEDVDFALASFRNIRVLEMQGSGHGIIPVALLPELTEFIDAA